jgi:glyoxylate utilization-related uncharacterized protein
VFLLERVRTRFSVEVGEDKWGLAIHAPTGILRGYCMDNQLALSNAGRIYLPVSSMLMLRNAKLQSGKFFFLLCTRFTCIQGPQTAKTESNNKPHYRPATQAHPSSQKNPGRLRYLRYLCGHHGASSTPLS